MTDTEKYLFDLQGYLAVSDALTREQVDALNQIIDDKLATNPEPDKNAYRFGNTLSWGAPVRDLIANPRILPHLHAMVGHQPRLDHEYADIIRHGLGPIGARLHGGGTPLDPSQSYRVMNGKMVNGLVVVVYALKDVNPGDGGFACVPGSHKANFPLPDGWADMSTHLAPGVTPVPCRAGSAILFTEALTHGTLPWAGADERRSLFLKYCPHFMAWAATRYDAAQYPDLNHDARRMLESPNARYKGRPGALD